MKRFLVYLSLVGLPLAGYGQRMLTLDESIRMATENNKRTEAAQQQLLAAHYGLRSSKALFLPSVSLAGSALYSTTDGSYSSGSGNLPVLGADGVPTGQTAFFPGLDLAYSLDWIYGGGVKIEQPIYLGGKIRTAYRMSKIGGDLARQNKRLTEAEIIVETSRAYAEAVRAKELKSVAASYHELLEELMRTVERACRHGLKSQNDVLKVEVRLHESELGLRRAENGYRLAKMNLCYYTGLSLAESIDVESSLPQTDYAVQSDAGIYDRPEYIMLEQQTELARQKIAAARSELLPQIGLAGQYGYTNGLEINGQRMLDGWNVRVGVQVSVPIFHFGQRMNKVKAAQAQYAQARAERDDTSELLVLEMTQAGNNLDESFLERSLAEASVVSAEENLRTSRLQYEKGVETLSDYLEAQVLWQQARQTQVDARVNCYLKWLEYRKATGSIN